MFREAGKVSSYIFFCDKLVINIPGCFAHPDICSARTAKYVSCVWTATLAIFEKESHFYVVLSEGSVHEISWF